MNTSLTIGESSITASKQFHYLKNVDNLISRRTIDPDAEQLTIHETDYTTTIVNLKSIIENVKKQLNEYKSFPLNWDGYDGVTFKVEFVNSAIFLLYIIDKFFSEEKMIPDEITPCPLNDGSIDIELGLKSKCLIFTMHPNRNEITIYSEDNSNSNEEESDFERIAVEEKLIWLVN